MRRRQKSKKHTIRKLVLMVLFLTIGFCAYYGVRSFAADEIYLEVDGTAVAPQTPIEMTNETLQLNMKSTGTIYENTDLYEVDWTIEDQDNANPIASVEKGSSQTIGKVTALSPGTVTITVTVRDKQNGLATLASTTCKVHVVFSIDTTGDDSIFKNAMPTDTAKSLMVYADHSPIQLNLNFGDASNTQWTSNNTEIITVGQRTGIATPVGAGKTTITATYTASGSMRTETATLDVYVIPRVTDDSVKYSNGEFEKSLANSGKSRGEYLYLDSFFGENNTETLGDKVTWVIKKDSGSNREVIANSLPANQGGITSSLISLDPPTSQSSVLEINAKAGVYYIEFYSKGTYNSETDRTSAYPPTTVKLTVYANFDNYEKVLSVGDKYDLPTAFNLTKEDFTSLFNPPNLTYGGTDASNYANYDATTAMISTKKSGLIDVAVVGKSATAINSLTNPSSPLYGTTTFNMKLNIVDSFSLDRSSVIICQGQTLQLNAINTGSVSYPITWSSSDSNYVTVDSNGRITGIKESTGKPDVIITAQINMGDGKVATSTCTVKVEPTISDFTLDPTMLNMNLGGNATIKVVLRQNVSSTNLIWSVQDSSIATVEPAADGKSAIVTAKKGGTTQLNVVNPDSQKSSQWCTIKVQVPIQSMSFADGNSATVSMDGNNTSKLLRVNYLPTSSNATDMQWNSSNQTVATVEEVMGGTGFKQCNAKLLRPGTTVITVSPKYNPYNVSASCTLTVAASATGLTLNPTEMVINVGDDPKQIRATMTPLNTASTISWISDKTDIASVDAEGYVTAKKAGTAIITALTSSGIVKTCQVTVKQPSTGAVFNPGEVIISTGGTYKPVVTLTPADSTDDITSWVALNSAVATVDPTGVITGKSAGETWIIATTTSGKTAFLHTYVRDGVQGIALSERAKTIYGGQTFTLKPIFTPITAYNKNITWSSTNSSVATVKESGDASGSVVVSGVKGGVALITATAQDGGKIAYCTVTVVERVTSVTVSPTTYYLKLGSTFHVKAAVKNPTASNKGVTWKSNKTSVATVSSSGAVKGKKLGTAYIKATARDGSGKSAQCKVIVVRKVTSVRLNKYSASILVGNTLQLYKYIKPKNASVKSCSWTSSNNSVATVSSSGRVMGLKPGLVRIKVTARDGSGKSATCLVRVREPISATGVSVGKSEMTVAKGRKIPSGIAISPANSTSSLKYYSDDKYVATVDKHGKIYCKRTGQVTIYGRTSNGKEGYVDVLVVGINRGSLTMRQYDAHTLWVNEISKGVTWYSSNPLVASVSNGKVVGRKPGRTTIYAIVRGVKLSCRVKIKKLR